MRCSQFGFVHGTTLVCAQPRRPRTCRAPPACRGGQSSGKELNEYEWSAERLGFTEVGVILGAHGVRGEVRVRSVGDFGTVRLQGSGNRHLLRPGRKYPRPVTIEGGRRAPQSGMWLMRVSDVRSRDRAETLRGCRVFVRDDDLPPLRPGEFNAAQLVGLRVQLAGDEDKEMIGVVRTVHFAADACRKKLAKLTSDTLEIALVPAEEWITSVQDELNRTKPSESVSLDEQTCVLIPFVEQIVPFVSIEDGFIEIDPPPGLFDIAIVNKQRKPKRPRGLLSAASTI